MSMWLYLIKSFFFFFNDTATTEIYTLSLHDALPIRVGSSGRRGVRANELLLPKDRGGTQAGRHGKSLLFLRYRPGAGPPPSTRQKVQDGELLARLGLDRVDAGHRGAGRGQRGDGV